MENTTTRPVGGLKISHDVIASIARVTTLEVDGIHSLAEPTRKLSLGGVFSSPLIKKGIHIDMNDDFANISVSVNIKYGAKITEVCAAVQNNVKDNVQTMTGLAVSKVNVLVAGIVFSED